MTFLLERVHDLNHSQYLTCTILRPGGSFGLLKFSLVKTNCCCLDSMASSGRSARIKGLFGLLGTELKNPAYRRTLNLSPSHIFGVSLMKGKSGGIHSPSSVTRAEYVCISTKPKEGLSASNSIESGINSIVGLWSSSASVRSGRRTKSIRSDSVAFRLFANDSHDF